MNKNKNKNSTEYLKAKIPLLHYTPLILIHLLIIFISCCFTYMYIYTPKSTSIITKCQYIRIPIIIIFFISTIMIEISYYQAVMINNSIQKIDKESLSSINKNQTKSSSIPNINNLTYCKKCSSFRPLRSHHCSKCNICIRQMDHHCPWITNCVGESNHKAFFLLLSYSILSTFIASFCIFNELTYHVQHNDIISDVEYIESLSQLIFSIISYIIPLFIFLCIMSTFIIVTVLLVNQINFLTFNMTHIEWLQYPKKKYECPYFENNILKHFYEIFGKKWYQWFIPNALKDNSIYESTGSEDKQKIM